MPIKKWRNVTWVRDTFRTQKRIKIPGIPERPLKLHRRTVIKTGQLKADTSWYTYHRRGPRRLKVGQDPLEARAIPKEARKGTLPERIVLRALLHMGFTEPADFEFQSSQDGGRLEYGGLVLDFLFPLQKLVIQVDGPTHNDYLRQRKDEEQAQAMADYGLSVWHVKMDLIYNEYRLDTWLRRLFALHVGGAGGQWIDRPQAIEGPNNEEDPVDVRMKDALSLVRLLREDFLSLGRGL